MGLLSRDRYPCIAIGEIGIAQSKIAPPHNQIAARIQQIVQAMQERLRTLQRQEIQAAFTTLCVQAAMTKHRQAEDRIERLYRVPVRGDCSTFEVDPLCADPARRGARYGSRSTAPI